MRKSTKFQNVITRALISCTLIGAAGLIRDCKALTIENGTEGAIDVSVRVFVNNESTGQWSGAAVRIEEGGKSKTIQTSHNGETNPPNGPITLADYLKQKGKEVEMIRVLIMPLEGGKWKIENACDTTLPIGNADLAFNAMRARINNNGKCEMVSQEGEPSRPATAEMEAKIEAEMEASPMLQELMQQTTDADLIHDITKYPTDKIKAMMAKRGNERKENPQQAGSAESSKAKTSQESEMEKEQLVRELMREQVPIGEISAMTQYSPEQIQAIMQKKEKEGKENMEQLRIAHAKEMIRQGLSKETISTRAELSLDTVQKLMQENKN